MTTIQRQKLIIEVGQDIYDLTDKVLLILAKVQSTDDEENLLDMVDKLDNYRHMILDLLIKKEAEVEVA